MKEVKRGCDDAITGVKQEKGGTEGWTERKKKKEKKRVFFLAGVSLRTAVFFFGEGSHTPAHPSIKTL